MTEAEQPIDEGAARSVRRRRRWSRILAVVGAVLLPLAGLSFWGRNQLLDTNHYVDTVAPLASQPDIQAAVTDRVSQAVADGVDLKARAQAALPDQAKFLAAPIAAAGQNLVHDVAANFVASDEFRRLWEEVNREAHAQVNNILTGKSSSAVQNANGKIVLRLEPIAQRVLQRLDQVVPIDLSKVPVERLNTEIVLVDSQSLDQVQTLVQWFNGLTWVLIVLAAAALIGSVFVAADRRQGLQRAGLAVAISMTVTLLLYNLGRDAYISSLPSEVKNPQAATAAFDIITRYLQRGIRTLLVLGVVLFAVAWVLGPSRSATRVRELWNRIRARSSAELASAGGGSASTWVAAHANELRFAIVGVAVAALLVWDKPTSRAVLFLTILAVLALGVVSVLAGAAPTAKETS